MVVDLRSPDRAAGERADRIFHALADSTRRDIVAVVLRGDRSVSDLARRYPISVAAVQKHVIVLERAGLISKQRRGREQRVSGNVDTLRAAHGLLDQLEAVWRARIDRIEDLLAGSARADPNETDPNEGDPNDPDRTGARP